MMMKFSFLLIILIEVISTHRVIAVDIDHETHKKHIDTTQRYGISSSSSGNTNTAAAHVCGSGWQEHYAEIHASATRVVSSTPPHQWERALNENNMRIVVALIREGRYGGQFSGGIGDRFTGLITLFALALLNDVPFYLDFPRLSDVFITGGGRLSWALNITDYIDHHGYENVKTSFLFWRQGEYEANEVLKKLKTIKTSEQLIQHLDKKKEEKIYFQTEKFEQIQQINKRIAKKEFMSEEEYKSFIDVLSPLIHDSKPKPQYKLRKKSKLNKKKKKNRRKNYKTIKINKKLSHRRLSSNSYRATFSTVDLRSLNNQEGEKYINDPKKFTKDNQYRIEYLLNTRTITVARNTKGFIMQLFKEKKYFQRLKDWGLTQENMYGCLFDYLFRPNDTLRSNFKKEIESLSKPNTIKILLQIRAGDDQIGKRDMNLTRDERMKNLASVFFECANRVEQKALTSSTSSAVIWYLMTDSDAIKQYARETYGNKVLMHNSTIVNMLENKRGYNFRAFCDIIGEQWCGSKCNYFITSSFSGLGMQAAFRSKRVDGRVFPINNRMFDEYLIGPNGPHYYKKLIYNGLKFVADPKDLPKHSLSDLYAASSKELQSRHDKYITLNEVCNVESVEAYGERYSSI